MITQRLQELRTRMHQQGIDAVLIPSADFHQSEYVGEYFKARAFISGFTGSAGLVIVTPDEAHLWTDGRYFIQAEHQLKDTGISLMKMEEEGVPTPEAYLSEHLPEHGTLAVDGRVLSVAQGHTYETMMREKNGTFHYTEDLLEGIWKDRPPLSEAEAFELGVEYAGESRADKLRRVREQMKDAHATHHISSALDDNCWMLNIRGEDVRYSPLVLCHLMLSDDDAVLFVDEKKLPAPLHEHLIKDGIRFQPYNAIYDAVKELPEDARVLIDPDKVNYTLKKNLPDAIHLIEQPNPAILMKAMKNEVELKNIRRAHVKDGTAMVKFLHWLDGAIGNEEITEISAAEKLEAYREEQGDYLSASFAPIVGYGEHAAIVHYEATQETNKTLEPKGLVLMDTGANFIEGSTDITRTIALGPVTDEEKFHFTLVLKSHIALAKARFLHGASGYCLDMLARKPVWDHGLDFKHGTGHGLGYLLNIHEAPSGFRYRINPAKDEAYPIQPGMVLTNEPGLYMEGKHGIRTENVMVVKQDERTEYGQFLVFEPITLVPIDIRAIDTELLDLEEITYVNTYHKQVFNTLAPHLTEQERAWLREKTEKIEGGNYGESTV